MSLRVKCINYDTVHITTLYDMDMFTESLRHLITSGYKLTIDVFGTNISNQDPWRTLGVSPTPTRGYDPDICENNYKPNNPAGNPSTVLNIV